MFAIRSYINFASQSILTHPILSVSEMLFGTSDEHIWLETEVYTESICGKDKVKYDGYHLHGRSRSHEMSVCPRIKCWVEVFSVIIFLASGMVWLGTNITLSSRLESEISRRLIKWLVNSFKFSLHAQFVGLLPADWIWTGTLKFAFICLRSLVNWFI